MKTTILFIFISAFAFSQTSKSVLFLGNSYTQFNNLPSLVASIATSEGNSLIHDSNTPGGYTLDGHSTNTTSLNLIGQGGWDHVVLQEQSQLPSFPWQQFQNSSVPFAKIICDTIRYADSCIEPIFFNTWGRLNGDSQWDSINTFEKMNERLYEGYTYLASQNNAKRAPVGIGFQHLHEDLGSPITLADLYTGDGSHPSIYGSYLTACIMYDLIFEEECSGSSFLPTGISNSEAAYIQLIADHVVYDVDSINNDFTIPFASFSYVLNGNEVTFSNESIHAYTWHWDFGDGVTSNQENPQHLYSSGGVYEVLLTAIYCDDSTDTMITINTTSSLSEYDEKSLFIAPNPVRSGESFHFTEPIGSFVIFDAFGKVVMKGENKFDVKIDLSAGLYTVMTEGVMLRLVVLD